MSGRVPPSPNPPAVPPLPSHISSQSSNNPTSLPTAPSLPSYILSQGSIIPTFQQANIPPNHPNIPTHPDYISSIPISSPIAPPLPSYITPPRSNISTLQQSACMLPSDLSASQPSKISKNPTTQNELDSIQSMKGDFLSTSSAQSSLGFDFESHINKNPKNIDPNPANKAVTSTSPPPPPPPPPTTQNLNTQMDSLHKENHLNPIKIGMAVWPGQSETNTVQSTEKDSSSTLSAPQSSGSDFVSQIMAKSKNLRKTSNKNIQTSCNSDTPPAQDKDVCPKNSSNEVIPTSHNSGAPPPQDKDVLQSKSETNTMPSTERDSSSTLSAPHSSGSDFVSQIMAKSKNLRKTSSNLYPIQSSTEVSPTSCNSDNPPATNEVIPTSHNSGAPPAQHITQSKENNSSSTVAQQSSGSGFESLLKHEMLSRRESMNQDGSDDASSEDWEHVD